MGCGGRRPQSGARLVSRWRQAGIRPHHGGFIPVLHPAGIATVADFRKSHGIVKGNAGASLVDLGDGIAAIELHSKKDAVGEDITRLVTQVLNPASDAVRDFQGFVITGDGANFPSAQTCSRSYSSFRKGSGTIWTLPSVLFSA